jgi:hypothetical protein
MTFEEQLDQDRERLKPIMEEVFKLAKKHDLNFRQFKRLVDMSIKESFERFKVSN